VKYVYRHGRRIAVETISAGAPGKKRKPFSVQFVKLPGYWIKQLEQSNCPGTFKLAHRILKENFKRDCVGGGDIVLSSEATGLSRKVRSKAVKELIRLGLIKIEQNGNQAVRVIDIIFKEIQRKRIGPVRSLRERGGPFAGTQRTFSGHAAMCGGFQNCAPMAVDQPLWYNKGTPSGPG
jgi:hypothetical protein